MRSSTVAKLPLGRQWTAGMRAYDPVSQRSSLRGPIGLAIQTIDRCDARCVMCPYSSIDHSGPPERMDPRLFTRILEEARSVGTVRVLILMLQNEPLLDHRLGDRVREARELFGRSVVLVVVTHGALLSPERANDLLDVDRFEISIDAATEQTYNRVRPGLNYRAVVRNTEALLASGRHSVVVKFVAQRDNQDEEAEFARFWKARGAKVSIERLCNRAGTLDAFERLWAPRRGATRRLAGLFLDRLVPCCPLPFVTAPVRVDGRMILCSHDWGPSDTVGDLSTQSLAEIWNGEPINHYRHLLWTGRTQDSTVCRDCSLAGRFWQW